MHRWLRLGMLFCAGLLLTATTLRAQDEPPLINQSPERPFNLAPLHTAPAVDLLGPDHDTLLLVSSDFLDPDGTESPLGQHAMSQWQLALVNDEAGLIYDSGPTTGSLTSLTLTPADGIETGKTYRWRVRHADASGDPETMWSPWSEPTRFTIARKLIRNLQPEAYDVARLFRGVELYADTDATTATAFPLWLRGAALIQTRSGDLDTTATGKLASFESDFHTLVYVAYDARATTLPIWLQDWLPVDELMTTPAYRHDDDDDDWDDDGWDDDGWRRTLDLLTSDEDRTTRALYVKRFMPDTLIELGANLPDFDFDQPTTGGPLAMYSVIVHPSMPLNHRPYKPWIQYPSNGHTINMPRAAADRDGPPWWDDGRFDEDDLPDWLDPERNDEDKDDRDFETDRGRGNGNGNGNIPRVEGITIKGSPFKDADRKDTAKGTHKATQWQIATVYDMSRLVIDVTSERYLRRLPVPWEVLEPGRSYFVRIRYQDGSGKFNDWSPWSRTVMFTIAQPWNKDDDDEPTTPTTPVVLLDQDLTSDTSGWTFTLQAGDLTTSTEDGLCAEVPDEGVNLGEWSLDTPIELEPRAVYRATVRISTSNVEPNTQPLFMFQFANRFWRFGGTKYFLAWAGNEYLAGPEGRDYVMYFTPAPGLIERFLDDEDGMYQPALTENDLTDILFSIRILDTDDFGIRGGELCIESVKLERFDRPERGEVVFDTDRINEGTFAPTGTTRVHPMSDHTLAFNHPRGGFGGFISRDAIIPWEEGWVYRIRYQLSAPSQLDREDIPLFRFTCSSEDWQFGSESFGWDQSVGFVAPPTDDEVDGDPGRRGWYEFYTSSGPASRLAARGVDGLRLGIDQFNVFTDEYELPSQPGVPNSGQGRMHIRRIVVERVNVPE